MPQSSTSSHFTATIFIQLLLYCCNVKADSPKQASNLFLVQLDGEVGRENFTYYKFSLGGNLLLELISNEGDADIYITQKDVLPGFYPEKYDLHSASCGTDVVLIPGNFRRPITAGVFGHPSYDSSQFTLKVYQLPSYPSPEHEHYHALEFTREGVPRLSPGPEGSEEDDRGAGSVSGVDHVGERRREKKRSKGLTGTTGLLAVLELFEMIFL